MRQQGLCIVMLTALWPVALVASEHQDAAAVSKTNLSSQPSESASKSKEKPALAGATRVSTTEAARNAAKDVVKEHGDGTASEPSATPDVLEFHPDDSRGQSSAGAGIAPSSGSKKSTLKNVHGDAYGVLGSRGAARQAGGSVGASSKSGKSSIYVETDRSRESTPAPR